MGYSPGFSSLGNSVAAYQPYYAPPTFPQTNYINAHTPLKSVNMVPSVRMGYDRAGTYAGVVSSRYRTYGMTWLYSRGAQVKRWFRMLATGQVETTKFQPFTDSTWFSMFNGNLYRCGFPRNLGWSEKVPTIPPAALGTAPWQMTPMPQFRRNVYTRRSFTTAPAVPAKPQNG